MKAGVMGDLGRLDWFLSNRIGKSRRMCCIAIRFNILCSIGRGLEGWKLAAICCMERGGILHPFNEWIPGSIPYYNSSSALRRLIIGQGCLAREDLLCLLF